MITGDKMALRAPEPCDVDMMFLWENDRSVWPHGRTRAPMSRQMLWEYVHNYDADILAAGQSRMVIDIDGDAVGMVDLYDIDVLNRRAGVSIMIGKPYRNAGNGLAALKLLAEYAHKDLGLHQLWAVVSSDNAPSRALFAAAGYSVSGCLRSWVRIGEHYTDAYVHQLLLVEPR